jgi:probable F420-dependent oxidoreductase
MRFGVTMFATDVSIGPADLAREAEDRGFDSFFLPEHTHIPTSRRTPAPLGEPLPEEYRRTLDPFLALTAAAAATSRIRLGTGICLLAQRDPIVTAKEVATLDLLSGGRFTFGVGVGWNLEEMADHGVDPSERREIVRERILAMKQLWTAEEAAFKGDHVNVEPSWAWPKPVQKPHPPILLGGGGGPVLWRHLAEYADGWIPVGGRGIAKALPELRAALEAAGRSAEGFPIVPMGSRPEPGKLEYFAKLGITDVVLHMPSSGRDDAMRVLDAHLKVIAEYQANE